MRIRRIDLLEQDESIYLHVLTIFFGVHNAIIYNIENTVFGFFFFFLWLSKFQKRCLQISRYRVLYVRSDHVVFASYRFYLKSIGTCYYIICCKCYLKHRLIE